MIPEFVNWRTDLSLREFALTPIGPIPAKGVSGGAVFISGEGFSFASPPPSNLDESCDRCCEATSFPFSLATHDSFSDPPRSALLSCVS